MYICLYFLGLHSCSKVNRAQSLESELLCHSPLFVQVLKIGCCSWLSASFWMFFSLYPCIWVQWGCFFTHFQLLGPSVSSSCSFPTEIYILNAHCFSALKLWHRQPTPLDSTTLSLPLFFELKFRALDLHIFLCWVVSSVANYPLFFWMRKHSILTGAGKSQRLGELEFSWS